MSGSPVSKCSIKVKEISMSEHYLDLTEKTQTQAEAERSMCISAGCYPKLILLCCLFCLETSKKELGFALKGEDMLNLTRRYPNPDTD